MRRHNHLLGWIVVVGSGAEPELVRTVNAGLEGFVDDFGTNKSVVANKGVGFGLLIPRAPLPMRSWSFYQDRQSICFVEGDFYGDYYAYRPLRGEDPHLAEMLLQNYNREKSAAIAALNGCFSGFVFDKQSSTLSTFVDRLGARVLYWSFEKDSLVVSSNLASLRSLRLLDLDHDAAFQFLTIGFPIGERTLLRNISIQPPCTINMFGSGSKNSSYYWVPKRTKRVPLNETVQSIVHSMEDFMDRVHDRTAGKTLGLGLTGGHDSRLMLSALAYNRQPFEVIRFWAQNFDDPVAQKLCSAMDLPVHTLDMTSCSASELKSIKNNVFLYSEGSIYDGWNFAALGKKCAERELEHLLVGFSGGPVSGQLTVPEPEHFAKIGDLAKCALGSQMELLPFEKAQNLLNDVSLDVVEKTKTEWEDSFRAEEWRDTFSDICIWQRLANRNLKRVRNAMMPGLQYTQLIFPYLDSEVLDSYFSAPIELIQYQRAHCYAGYYRFKELGNYPATSFPLPLKWEARLPVVLHSLRMVWYSVQSVQRRMEYRQSISWNARRRHYAQEICNSPVFNRKQVEKLFSENRLNSTSLNKMHLLAKFFDFYVSKENKELFRTFSFAQ
jgi:hypothetical protein